MALEFVTPTGEQWKPNEAKKPRVKREPEPSHMGWRVEGHPPGALEAARDAAEKLCAEWRAMSADERAAELKAGRREPPAWNEETWIREAKRKPVAKPYAIPSSAETCVQLARKAGWLGVRIVELKRE